MRLRPTDAPESAFFRTCRQAGTKAVRHMALFNGVIVDPSDEPSLQSISRFFNSGYSFRPMTQRRFTIGGRARLCALITLLGLMLAAPLAHAQVLDSKGRDFWVAFMANLGSQQGNETSDLRLYFSSDRPTSVSVTYTLTGDTRVVNLPTPNVTTEVNINALFDDFVELDNVVGGNEIQPKSLHIVADNDITLYGANIRAKSADAFLGLPVDVLTGNYIVLAYPNGFSGNFFGNGGYDTPSEFAVVATEDGTTVNIAPRGTLTINQRAPAPFSVSLQRGEVYFGQADVYPDIEQDVSGTQISANKPVAVFGGCKRTSIPTRVGNYRDHLCEQLPPLDAWGRSALLTPHFRVTPTSTDTAVARIIAAFQGTDITITGNGTTQNVTLGPGATYEVPLLEALSIVGSQPIMVAQYEHSVNVAGPGSASDIGDPFMMLVPPPEQYDTAYAFQSIVHPEFTNAHYINVVIPPQAISSLRLDGAALSSAFNPIPGSNYFYTQMKVSGGSHYIRADSAFGLFVYGFGSATSYGYPGGMLFRKLVRDFEAPELTTSSNCGDLVGFTWDSRITDTGIDSCYATSDTQNVVVTVQPFTSGADTVFFRARLIDPYRDGVVALRSVDREGRGRSQVISVPGFTVRFAGSTLAPALLDTFVAINAESFCRSIVLKNYGRFPQTVTGISLSDSTDRWIDTTGFPLVIAPNDSAVVQLCFRNLPDSVISTELTAIGPCASRMFAIVPVDNRIDTTAPSVGIEGAPCSDDFILTYFERVRSAGIAALDVDSTVNCTAERLIDPARLPAQMVQVKLHRVDPRQDMIYQVTLRDAAGNKLIDRDTIGGFTLNLLGLAGDTLGTRYERQWTSPDSISIEERTCDSINIINYGLRPVHIHNVVLRGNKVYSVPPTQFPFDVPAGGSKKLLVCLEGLNDWELIDTLILEDACGHYEALAMNAPVNVLQGSTDNGCGAVINFATYAPTKRAFLTAPLPNPVVAAARMHIGLPTPDKVTLKVYSATGEPVLDVLLSVNLRAGINQVDFPVRDLEAGAYFCRMTTANGHQYVAKMIVRR